jgi:hypothetical protein
MVAIEIAIGLGVVFAIAQVRALFDRHSSTHL